jgi:hypothetical protein
MVANFFARRLWVEVFWLLIVSASRPTATPRKPGELLPIYHARRLRELRRAFPLAATFSEREIWLLPRKGRGTECGARHKSDKGGAPHHSKRMMSVMPFFEFVLVMVGVSTLAILLTALVLTATARLH